MKGGLLLEQFVISRKYIKFILQVILAVCIQCVITFFWHQERTFLFYTLLTFSDTTDRIVLVVLMLLLILCDFLAYLQVKKYFKR